MTASRDAQAETSVEVSQMVSDIMTKSVWPLRQKKAISEGKKGMSESELKHYLERILKPLTRGSFSFKNREEFWEKASTPFALMHYCESIIKRTRRYEESFNFISPFRLPPERTYYRKAKKALKVDKFGDNCIDQLLEWEARGGKNLEQLKTILRSLSLVEDVHTKRFEGGRYELCVKAPKRELSASICDVGFGVSQVSAHRGGGSPAGQRINHANCSTRNSLAPKRASTISKLFRRSGIIIV